MTQKAKNHTNLHSEKKHQDNETIKNTVHGIKEGVEGIRRTADEFNHKAVESIGMCSENIGALLGSGTAASRICIDINNEIIESCNRTASELSDISQEALACRTLKDVMNLQTRSCEQLSRSYFDMANKISRMTFDAWSKTLTPVLRQADISAKQMRKAA